ncbi:hypothetical protein MHU86_4513 [Fragilaria crotonensis]|nr:hypothetical protein MHU86_4513 [Fragilaria crotonensis]
MWLLANAFHERLPQFLGQHQALAGTTPWGEVYPAHVLRHVQINAYEYLQALQVGSIGGTGEAGDTPELPSFRDLLRDLQRGSFHMSPSWLPLPMTVTVEPTPPASGGTGSINTRTTRASTAASAASSLTSTTSGGRGSGSGGTAVASTQGTYVANPARDTEFDTLQLRPQMRDLLRAHPPLANDAGNEFCVSWWGRGGCYTNCGRAATHRPIGRGHQRLTGRPGYGGWFSYRALAPRRTALARRSGLGYQRGNHARSTGTKPSAKTLERGTNITAPYPQKQCNSGRPFNVSWQRSLQANPAYGPVYLAKIDIADGFYRIGLQPRDIPRLGVVLPSDTSDPLVAFPLALPMGWVESPPYFTSVTETACDLLNAALRRWDPPLPHRLETLAATPPATTTQVPTSSTVAAAAWQMARMGSPTLQTPPLAYVDDFILAAQTTRHQRRVMCTALHSIDRVLRPLSPADRSSRKEPVSVKKLRQGDACWSTRKVVLGWDLDTVADTLRQKSRHRLRLTRQVFDSLADFRLIAASLRDRPTRLREFVPSGIPVAFGACDACGRGMGGVWFRPNQGPIVWRATFPRAIQRALVTSDNRSGTLSISDLELAGTLAHKHALVQCNPAAVAERLIWMAGDNRASLAWATKGSSTTRSARAYLLRLNALHQRRFRYVPHHDFIAGKSNVMADDARHLMDVAPPGTQHALCRDWCAVETTLRASHSTHRVAATAATSRVWLRFCRANGICPDLSDIPGDPVPVLLLFAHQYRTGRIAPRDRPVRSRTVEEAVRQVAQAFSRVGSVDPRLNSFGDLDFRLRALFRAWHKADPPPTRVKPLPLSVIRQAYALAFTQPPASRLAATGDCLVLAYYFLLRPGEYSGCPAPLPTTSFASKTSASPLGTVVWTRFTALNDLLAASFGSVTFTSQKNGVGARRSATAGAATLCAPSMPSSAAFSNFALTAPPCDAAQRLQDPDGTWQYVLPLTLPPSCALPSRSFPTRTWRHVISPPVALAPAAPWPCSAAASAPIAFAS